MSTLTKIILLLIIPFSFLKVMFHKRLENNDLNENEHLFI